MNRGRTENFSELSAVKQRAIVLKTNGLTHAAIAAQLQADFGVDAPKKKTVDKWLTPAGVLWSCYCNVNERIADQALMEAYRLVRACAGEAVQTLRELSKPPHPASVRVNASRSLASVLLRDSKIAIIKQPPSQIDQEIASIIASARIQGE